MQNCELFRIIVGIWGAMNRFAGYEGECNFTILLNICTVCVLFRIKYLNESQILDIVATTKCSSYAETFEAETFMAKGFLDI